MRGAIVRRALSAYEGEKRLDKKLERLAIGDLKPRVQSPSQRTGEHVGEWWCDHCRQWKKSFELVRVRTYVPGIETRRIRGLQGWYLSVCAGCRPVLRAVGL